MEVVAFEPYAPARQLLDANIVRNAISQMVTAQAQALGAGLGRAVPDPLTGNRGATRLRMDLVGQVTVVSLDSLRPQLLDLQKIAVEGNEMAVLHSASHAIALPARPSGLKSSPAHTESQFRGAW